MATVQVNIEPLLNPVESRWSSLSPSPELQHPNCGAGDSLETLARALFLSPHQEWAMIAAYFDESGTHDDSQIMVLGGLVSPVFQWERLTRSWEGVLSEHGLEDFHTVDCAAGQNAFRSWDPKRRSDLYKRLVALTTRHVLWRTWTAIVVPDYLQFFKDRKRAHHLAYSVCASGCASRILQLAQHRDTHIPYVFEQGGRGGKYAVRTFSELIESGDKDVYRMASLTVESSRRLIPLQAADLHVYEVYKYFADQLAGKPRLRRSFAELLKIQEVGGGGYLYTADKLQEWVRRMKAGERPIRIPVDQLNLQNRVALRLVESGTRRAPTPSGEPPR